VEVEVEVAEEEEEDEEEEEEEEENTVENTPASSSWSSSEFVSESHVMTDVLEASLRCVSPKRAYSGVVSLPSEGARLGASGESALKRRGERPARRLL